MSNYSYYEAENFIYEISQRLADEPDYEDYLMDKLLLLIFHLKRGKNMIKTNNIDNLRQRITEAVRNYNWNKNLPECLKTTDENDNMFILTQDDLAELNEAFETLPAGIRTKLIDVFVNSHIPSIEK